MMREHRNYTVTKGRIASFSARQDSDETIILNTHLS